MHPYSIDTSARRTVDGVLMLVALVVAVVGYRCLASIEIQVPPWLDAPGVVGVFGGLRWWFEQWVWRWRWVTPMHGVPILHGDWEGFGRSSYDEFAERRQYSLRVAQSWSRIEVTFKASGSSHSRSYVAALSCDRSFPELFYAYRNQPEPEANLAQFAGVATLRFDDGRLVGDYFTDGSRGNRGSLEFDRVQAGGTR